MTASIWDPSGGVIPEGIQDLRNDLASSAVGEGGALVKGKGSKSGEIEFTLLEYTDWGNPNVMRCLSATQRADYLSGAGTIDISTPVQTYVTTVNGAAPVEFPAGTMKLTKEILLPSHGQLFGAHKNQSGNAGGTKILFQPTTLKSLFVKASPGTLQDGFCIDGFWVLGNSTDATGNSLYGLDITKINKSRFANMSFSGFRTAVQCNSTVNNRFEFIQMANSYISNISYTGGQATTDVWDQMYCTNAPIGIQTSGTNLNIRFNRPILESIELYGLNLVRESYGFSFTDTYAEDINSGNNAAGALFRCGHDGTTNAGAINLIVAGGKLGGRNAGKAGYCFDLDHIDGVIFGGFHMAHWITGVQTSGFTSHDQIISYPWTAGDVTNICNDKTKMAGIYPQTVFNDVAQSAMNAKFYDLRVDNLINYANDAAAAGGGLVTGDLYRTAGAVMVKL